MRRNVLLTVLLAALMMFGVTACDSGEDSDDLKITEAQAREDLHANLQANLGAFASSTNFVRESSVACGAVRATAGGVVGSDAEPGADGEVQIDCASALDLKSPLDQLVETLTTEIFIEANVEKRTSTSVTYLLPNSDPFPVRFVVTSERPGDIDVDIKVGDKRETLAELEIYRNHLAVEIELDDVADVIEAIARAEDPSFRLPGSIDGRLRLQLNRNADESYGVALSVLEAVKVELDGSLFDQAEPVRISIARSTPAFALDLDPTANEIAITTALGAVDLSVPMDLLSFSASETCNSEGCVTESGGGLNGDRLDFHLGGATAAVLFNALSESIELTGVSLGNDTTRLSVDGRTVLALDLNADHGRSFNATLTADADGRLQIAVEPSFQLALDVALGGVWDSVADWLSDDEIEISLSGADRPTIALQDGELEVVSGTLTLTSSAQGTLSVNAGQCLLGDIDDGGLIAGLQAGACGQGDTLVPTPEPEPAPEPTPDPAP